MKKHSRVLCCISADTELVALLYHPVSFFTPPDGVRGSGIEPRLRTVPLQTLLVLE